MSYTSPYLPTIYETRTETNSLSSSNVAQVTATKTVVVTIISTTTKNTCASLYSLGPAVSIIASSATEESEPEPTEEGAEEGTEEGGEEWTEEETYPADCTPNCAVVSHLRVPSLYTWSALKITSTFTAATVVTIINTSWNRTTVTTVFNPIPTDVTPPFLNSHGTQVGFVGGHYQFVFLSLLLFLSSLSTFSSPFYFIFFPSSISPVQFLFPFHFFFLFSLNCFPLPSPFFHLLFSFFSPFSLFSLSSCFITARCTHARISPTIIQNPVPSSWNF